MVRMGFTVALHYQVQAPGADFIFNAQAARTPQQRVFAEQLDIGQPVRPQLYTDPVTRSRFVRLHAEPGPLRVTFGAMVDIHHHLEAPQHIGESRIADMPGPVLPYLYPSRYCESDRLNTFAMQTFGILPLGYARVLAIRDWVRGHVQFQSNSSTGTTSAWDTLASQRGVCRDFAHLTIALCRAVNIPARFSTGFDYGADPALGPPDFHACVEVWLGCRWYLFDPSGTAIPMGFVRIGTAHDAADAAFATIFGMVISEAPSIRIEAVPDDQGVLTLPQHTEQAISTDAGDA